MTDKERKEKMTIADELEIANLLADAASMKKLADNMNRLYHDEKIAEYAGAAISDFKETKDYIVKTIDKNIALFFDLDNLRVDNSSLGYSFDESRVIANHCLGKFLHIVFKFHPLGHRAYSRGNAGGLYTWATPDEIEIVDVRAETSDTSLPEYRVCSAWSLTDPNAKRGGRCYALFGNYDAKTWNKIYNYATWSREQTKLLWRSFKEVLKERVSAFHKTANDMEALRKRNSGVGVYVKVERV